MAKNSINYLQQYVPVEQTPDDEGTFPVGQLVPLTVHTPPRFTQFVETHWPLGLQVCPVGQ